MRCDLTATAAFLNAHTCMHFTAAEKNVYRNDWASGDIFKRFRVWVCCVCFPLIMIQALFTLTTEGFLCAAGLYNSRTIFPLTLVPQV